MPAVLIVEDNEETRYILERVLGIGGYQTVSAEDVPTALARLRNGYRPAVIVLDLHLPGMDGMAFLREVKADAALTGIPVVAFTGHAGERPAGLAAFVRKGSDDPDVLLNAIASCTKA